MERAVLVDRADVLTDRDLFDEDAVPRERRALVRAHRELRAEEEDRLERSRRVIPRRVHLGLRDERVRRRCDEGAAADVEGIEEEAIVAPEGEAQRTNGE